MTKEPYSFDQEVDWFIVDKGERLEQVARELADQKFYAWDVETSGRSVWHGSRIVGHSFAWRVGRATRAVYIPVRHKPLESELFQECGQLPVEMVTAALKPILEGPARKTGHNISFDIHHGRADGINVAPPYVDTLCACRLIDERWYNHQLHTCLAKSRIPHEEGWKKSIQPQINERAKQMKMAPKEWVGTYGYQYLTVPVLGRYGCQDAAFELFLAEWAVPRQTPWQNIWELEMDLLSVILDMETVGVPVDVAALQRIADKEKGRMADLEPRIFGLAGCEWELTNDEQTRDALYRRLAYEAPSRTDKGMPSIDDDALWHLEQQGHEIAGLIRKWNTSQKIVSTYTLPIIGRVDSHGILHTEIDPGGAKTGRVSSRNPNLQNIPVRTEVGRQVREAFISRPGMVRYCLDYSQIELRVLAHLSQDPLLLKIYREGLDAHKISALEAFGTAEVVGGVDMRRIAKILNFGVSFGMTHIGLMGNVNKDLPPGASPITEDQAKDFIAQFYRKYTGVKKFQQYLCYQVAATPGHEFRNLFGRPRRMGDGFDVDAPRWKRGAEERQAVSSMVQGSAADLVKHSMVACWKYIKAQTACESYMVLMVHDDLQFDMVPEGSARCVREVKRLMEATCQAKLSVPIQADVEWFNVNWATKHKMKGL